MPVYYLHFSCESNGRLCLQYTQTKPYIFVDEVHLNYNFMEFLLIDGGKKYLYCVQAK